MVVGLIGLGRMGRAIAVRLLRAGFDVYGYDKYMRIDIRDLGDINLLSRTSDKAGVFCQVQELCELAAQTRIFWLMVPAGDTVDHVLGELIPFCKAGDAIIDGGNSFFKNSVRRHDSLARHAISFLDCGTSGGLHGEEAGFSLMIGGEVDVYTKCLPIFKAIAMREGYGLVGPAGAGHYVKMVHNGIEYGLLQAYAEGFHVLKDGSYKNLDLEKISDIWNNGSIIRSWILSLTRKVFAENKNFDEISGAIGENKTGFWTVEEAKKQNIPVDVIEKALLIRAESRKTGGNYTTKLVALLRKAFGGHPVDYLKREKKDK